MTTEVQLEERKIENMKTVYGENMLNRVFYFHVKFLSNNTF